MIGDGRGWGLLIGGCASAAAHLVVLVLITLLPSGPAAMGVSGSNASSSSAGSPGGGFPGDLAGSVGGDGGSGPGVTAATAARSRLSIEGDSVAGSAVTEPPRSRQGDSAIAQTVTRIARDVTLIPDLVAHLWESTLFALAIGLLTLLVRRHAAAVRYRLWVVASLKFLVPFSLLTTMGGYMAWMLPVQPLAATADVTSSTWFASTTGWRSVTRVTASPSTIGEGLVAAVAVVWLLGIVCVAVMRFRIWRRIRAAVRVSLPLAPPPLDVPRDVEVRLAPGLLEPGVVGWRHPILLLPADLGTHLTSFELDAVIAHEMCHVRRWDNHTAMLHMLTEALFWFHPLVWWIGARLVSERERACDEAVLRQGTQPTVYAQAIIKTCARYVASPLACVAGVTGSDLQQRIEMIMTNALPLSVNLWRRVAVGGALFLAIALPLGSGMRNGAIVVIAQTPTNVPDDVRFEVVSIRPNPAGRGEPTSRQVQPGGRFVATNMPIKLLIGEVYRVPELRIVGGPDWLETEHFDIDARANRELTPGPGGALDTALRALLADRFKLVVRTEMRDMPIFALVTARPDRRLGPNLQPATRTDCDQLLAARNAGRGRGGPPGLPPPPPPPGSGLNAPPCGARTYPGRVVADSMPLSYLAGWVGGELRRTTIDRTGLMGRYNYVLTWTPDQLPPADADVPPIDVNSPSLATALEEQLGLKIESARGPVEVFVIERVERPLPN